MNKTTIAKLAAAAALVAAPVLAAAPASASTNGCMLAKFTCGTFVPYVANSGAVARPGWSATAAKPGAAVVLEPDRSNAAASDFYLNVHGRDVRIEYAPHGKLTHLYVGVNVISAYVQGGVKVTAGGLNLAGWNGSWAERWTEKPVKSGGFELVNDMTGAVVVPGAVGKDIGTGKGPAAWTFQGN